MFLAWERSKEALHCGIDDSSKNDKAKIWSWNFRQNLKYRISHWLRLLRNNTKMKLDLSVFIRSAFFRNETQSTEMIYWLYFPFDKIAWSGICLSWAYFFEAHFIKKCCLYWQCSILKLLFNPIMNFETKHYVILVINCLTDVYINVYFINYNTSL